MSGLTGGGSRPAPPPPPPAPGRPERMEDATRMRKDEMARRRGGAQVLAGETTGEPMTGSKRLLGQ